MLKIQIRDVKNPDPGWKKSRSGMNISEHISEGLETNVWVKNTKTL
jgi:hypothetical protein